MKKMVLASLAFGLIFAFNASAFENTERPTRGGPDRGGQGQFGQPKAQNSQRPVVDDARNRGPVPPQAAQRGQRPPAPNATQDRPGPGQPTTAQDRPGPGDRPTAGQGGRPGPGDRPSAGQGGRPDPRASNNQNTAKPNAWGTPGSPNDRNTPPRREH